jgi:flavin-dependent dehydrogenase
MRALEELLPGFGEELAQAGAVEFDPGYDVLFERLGQGRYTRQRFGSYSYAMSRPLMELTLRRRVEQHRNIAIGGGCRVLEILGTSCGGIVTGVSYETRNKGRKKEETPKTLNADLVVDASAHGAPTLAFFIATGRTPPEKTVIGIDTHYSSAVFAAPVTAGEFKVMLTYPKPPTQLRYGYLYAAENNRWQVLLIGRGNDIPPSDGDGFLNYAQQIEPSSIYDAIKNAVQVDKITRFGFRESVWRHFGRHRNLPRGLFPIGDAMCRLNPVYGQGMIIALQEANMLHHLLQKQCEENDPLATLGQNFLAKAAVLIEDAWETSTIPDLAYPETRGERPIDLEDKLKFRSAVSRIATRDAAFHKLFFEIRHLIKPIKALDDYEIIQRVREEMGTVPSGNRPDC